MSNVVVFNLLVKRQLEKKWEGDKDLGLNANPVESFLFFSFFFCKMEQIENCFVRLQRRYNELIHLKYVEL